MTTTIQPKKVSEVDAVFGPRRISDYLPAMQDIPEEFKQHQGTKWNKIFSDWFFSGLKNLRAVPKKGINKDDAIRHISCCMESWETQHEHKEAGCAYLLSLWFESFEYDKAK